MCQHKICYTECVSTKSEYKFSFLLLFLKLSHSRVFLWVFPMYLLCLLSALFRVSTLLEEQTFSGLTISIEDNVNTHISRCHTIPTLHPFVSMSLDINFTSISIFPTLFVISNTLPFCHVPSIFTTTFRTFSLNGSSFSTNSHLSGFSPVKFSATICT